MPNEKIGSFLDSNVLLYAASERSRDPRRFDIALDLVLGTLFGVSGQTLAEFVSVARRKKLLEHDEIERWLSFLATFPSVAVDHDYVAAGLAVAHRYQINYYDAALLAAAERLGAPVFYTEDLSHNQVYGSVRVVNPFL